MVLVGDFGKLHILFGDHVICRQRQLPVRRLNPAQQPSPHESPKALLPLSRPDFELRADLGAFAKIVDLV